MNQDKHRKFAAIMGEWTFGLTNQPFTYDDVQYAYNAHQMNHLKIGWLGNVPSFDVMDATGHMKTLTRDQLQEWFAAAYNQVVAPQDAEFGAKYREWCEAKTNEQITALDPTQGWTKRNPALVHLEKGGRDTSTRISKKSEMATSPVAR